jgi:hypothetical protein
MSNELHSTTIDNSEYLKPITEGLSALLEGRKSRDKFNAKFWGELRSMCAQLVANDPQNIQFIEPGSPQAYFYSRSAPHVLCTRIELVIRLKHVDHCLFVVAQPALTEDDEAELVGRTQVFKD